MSEIQDEVAALLLSSRCSMFHPGNRDNLLTKWKELRDIPSFMALQHRPQDMMFVYFYACPLSYAVRFLMDDRKRIQFAIDAVYMGKLEKKIQEAYLNHKWSAEMEAAIADMQLFEPSVRAFNKIAAERMMRNLEFVLRTNFEDKPMKDWTETGNAIRAMELAAEVLPRIQAMAETGFGIAEVRKEEEPPGQAWSMAKHAQPEEV